MRSRLFVVIGFAALTAAWPAVTDAAEVSVSLPEAIELAMSKNHALLASRERALASHASADVVGRGLWPRVAFESQWSRTDNAAMVFMGKLTSGMIEGRDFNPLTLNDPGSRSHLATRLSIEAPVDPFGRQKPLKDGSRATAKSADAVAREQALELRLRVTEAYAHAAVSGERIRALEVALAAVRSREAEIDARVSEGAALKSDLLRARARRREREAELAGLRAERSSALAGLNELLGASEETSYEPLGLPTDTLPIELADEAALIARAISNRPALDALRLRTEAANHVLAADRRSRLPEMGVLAHLSDDRGGFSEGRQSYGISAFVRISLFDPARNARQGEALLKSRAAELDRLAGLDSVRRAVRDAREQVYSRLAAKDAARGGAEEGDEALRVIQERRREGLATLTDELETEASALNARLRELTTQVELVVARATLARVTGDTQ